MGMGIVLSINQVPIDGITVIRIEKFRNKNSFHDYRVTHNDKKYYISHLYSDGALVLAKKALAIVSLFDEIGS